MQGHQDWQLRGESQEMLNPWTTAGLDVIGMFFWVEQVFMEVTLTCSLSLWLSSAVLGTNGAQLGAYCTPSIRHQTSRSFFHNSCFSCPSSSKAGDLLALGVAG